LYNIVLIRYLKGVLDTTDIPDIVFGNKSVKNKSDIVRHPRERKNGKAHTIGIGLRKN
jgi:hypothetical protein